MFRYCVDVLRFSEAASYKRIAAARAVRVFPKLLVAVERGELHVTAVRLLAPHLDEHNAQERIDWAKHMTGDQIVNRFGDGRGPASERTMVRRLPPVSDPTPPIDGGKSRGADRESQRPAPALPLKDVGTATPATTVPKPPVGPPSGPPPTDDNRVQIRFCASGKIHQQLRELQALMRHQYPDGDLAKILGHAIGVLHKAVRKAKFAECENPRAANEAGANQAGKPRARQIPAEIRRAVTRRDNGECSFTSDSGRQCGSTDFLEFHHEIPWAKERRHEVDNISLRCRAHNRLAAERDFGRAHMARFGKAETAGRLSTLGDRAGRGKVAREGLAPGRAGRAE